MTTTDHSGGQEINNTGSSFAVYSLQFTDRRQEGTSAGEELRHMNCWMARKSSFVVIVLKLYAFSQMSLSCECFIRPLRPHLRPGYQTIGDIPSVRSSPTNIHALLDDEDLTGADQTDYSVSKSTGQRILDLSVPALGALLIDPLLTIADTAFVGRFSESSNELAGMGSAAALLTFSFYLFNFLTTASTPLISAKRSSGKEAEALATGGQALSLAFVLGGILSIVLITFRQPLLSVMGTSISGPEANAYAIDFLTIRAIAAPAVFCISASTGILRGYLDTKTSIVVLVLANLINLALDIVLIGYLGYGPAGAAIATTTAEWISALLFLGVLSGKLPSADGQLGRKEKDTLVVTPTLAVPPWDEVKPLIVASSSVFFRSLSLQLSLSAAAALAARGGEAVPGGAASSISAHQIAIQLWLLCSFIADALAAASQGLVADCLGRNDPDGVRDVSTTVLRYSVVLGVILAFLLQIGYSTGFLLDFFTSDEGTQKALSEILTIIVLAQPLNSIVFAADGILQGASEFTYQAKSMFLSAGTAAIAFVLLQELDSTDTLVDIWIALITLQLMRGLTSAVKIVDNQGPIRLLSSSTSSSNASS
jgi:putative MATE family efflux protein